MLLVESGRDGLNATEDERDCMARLRSVVCVLVMELDFADGIRVDAMTTMKRGERDEYLRWRLIWTRMSKLWLGREERNYRCPCRSREILIESIGLTSLMVLGFPRGRDAHMSMISWNAL